MTIKAAWKKAWQGARAYRVENSPLEKLAQQVIEKRDEGQTSLAFRLAVYRFKSRMSFRDVLGKK